MSSVDRWIFLRGLTRGNIHWGSFPIVFKEINPNVEMEFLEIPGNGSLFHEITPVDGVELVETLRKKSRFVKDGKKFNLCGISLGGMGVLKWAELYPDEVSSVTIINSSLSQCSPFHKRLLPKNYLNIIKMLFMKNIYKVEEKILQITSNDFQKHRHEIEGFAQFSKKHKMMKKNFFRQLLLARSIRLQHPPVVPFKIISSKSDRLVDATCSDEIASVFGGQQSIHPTAGHDLPLDESEWLSHLLVDNLKTTK